MAKKAEASRIIDCVAGNPWAITPDALRLIYSIANRESLVGAEAFIPDKADSASESQSNDVPGNVAIIKIHGPIFRRANLFNAISGATSVESIQSDFLESLDDASIESIILDIDSPGGEVNGINDFQDMVFSAREKKEVTAVVGGIGASAAFWIASAASRVVISETAIVGSIGTIIGFEDDSEKLKNEGVKELHIVSSDSPKKNLSPFTEEGFEDVLSTINKINSVFVSKVARNRGVSIDNVLENFGRGGVIVGSDAVSIGMVDGIDTLNNVIMSHFSTERVERRINMDNNLPEMIDNKRDEVADISKRAVSDFKSSMDIKGIKSNFPDIVKSIEESAIIGENNRISAIEEAALPHQSDLVATLKADMSMTPEKAAIALLADEKARSAKSFVALENDAEELPTIDSSQGSLDEASGNIKSPKNPGIVSQMVKSANEFIGVKK